MKAIVRSSARARDGGAGRQARSSPPIRAALIGRTAAVTTSWPLCRSARCLETTVSPRALGSARRFAIGTIVALPSL
ncbi:hypothetical protein BCD48_18635 [Pseudofrankia sp. BMG5.36]|nr:hypothetical protein BCD48_18635 [Pseudofrankia sp. BMG5.36]